MIKYFKIMSRTMCRFREQRFNCDDAVCHSAMTSGNNIAPSPPALTPTHLPPRNKLTSNVALDTTRSTEEGAAEDAEDVKSGNVGWRIGTQ